MESANSGPLGMVLLMVAAGGTLGAGGWWWVATTPTVVASSVPATRAGSVAGMPAAFPAVVVGFGVDGGLPRVPGTVWRHAVTMAEGERLDWAVPTVKGGRYLLQCLCIGTGELRIRVRGTEDPAGLRPGCDQPLQTVELVAAGDELRLTAWRPHPGAAEVGVQLVALP